MKIVVKALGATLITLPLLAGNTALADKAAKKRNKCIATAAAITGYNPKKDKKKDNSAAEKAKKFAKQYDKCMKGNNSIVKVPGF